MCSLSSLHKFSNFQLYLFYMDMSICLCAVHTTYVKSIIETWLYLQHSNMKFMFWHFAKHFNAQYAYALNIHLFCIYPGNNCRLTLLQTNWSKIFRFHKSSNLNGIFWSTVHCTTSQCILSLCLPYSDFGLSITLCQVSDSCMVQSY
jgi:hypothetical protein